MMTEKLNLNIPEEIIASHVERFRIYSPDGNYFEIDSKELGVKELGYVLYRDRFDQWMAEKAHELGAEIEKGKRWEGWKGDYDILVVADGKPEAERLWIKRAARRHTYRGPENPHICRASKKPYKHLSRKKAVSSRILLDIPGRRG